MNNDLFSQFPETALLSILLRHPETLGEVSTLQPFMFTSTPNRTIFETIKSLSSDGLMTEYGLIVARLQERGTITLAGDTSYIKYLFDQTYSPDNIKEYVSYVIDAYKARQLIAISSSIPTMLTDISAVDGAVSDIREALDKLSLNSDDRVLDMNAASRSAWEMILRKVDQEDKFEYTTGVSKLDAVTGGFWEQDLWIIAGRPGMGKSAFMCNSVLSGLPSLIFSLEMSSESLVHRMVSIKSGVPIFNIRLGQLSQNELDNIAVSLKEIKKLPIYIDSTFITSIDSVVSTIKKYVRMYGVKVVHLDYVQLLAERSQSAVHDIGKISRALKNVAKDLNIACVLYSQLNRGVELRDDKRPVLADLRQSGNLEEDADVVMFLYRDVMYHKDTKYPNELELLIRKQRNGPTGVVTATFNDQTNKVFEE